MEGDQKIVEYVSKLITYYIKTRGETITNY